MHIRRLAGPEVVYPRPVMWSETSPSILGQDRSEAKKIGLGLLVLQMCCFVLLFCETRSCHARSHNDLEGHSN